MAISHAISHASANDNRTRAYYNHNTLQSNAQRECISIRCRGSQATKQADYHAPTLPQIYYYAIPNTPAALATQPQSISYMAGIQKPQLSEAKRYNLPEKFHRQLVDYYGEYPVGTIIVDTNKHFLYHIQKDFKAMRYGIGVAREGFEWSGMHKVSKKREWPDWVPPAEMRKREPHLPEIIEGGENNPLGARALYLGNTLYRIHGTNQPWTIGQDVSSGCVRMLNEDVLHLYNSVAVGTKVIVL